MSSLVNKNGSLVSTPIEASANFEKEGGLQFLASVSLPLGLTILAGVAVWMPDSLTLAARSSLFAFALAVILWTTTSLNAAYVALGAVLFLTMTGGTSQERLFDALASDVVWLMIGAFMLGEAVRKTGLAERMTQLIIGKAQTVRGVFWLLTTALIPLTFFIPSTSGRAAVAIPIFYVLAKAANDRKITRALALLIPTVILVATISTLVGAGSHLIANDLLFQFTKQQISFVQWTLYGLPFGLAASYASCWVIMRLFLDRDQLDGELKVSRAERKPMSRAEWTTLGVIASMMAFWLTESRHHLEIATVTIAGALLLTAPRNGVLKWKDGLSAVSWNLVIFVGAALVLGQALIESGAAQWIITNLFALSNLAGTQSRMLILLILTAISLTSHLYMTSHTARAAALVPPILYLAGSLSLNPVAVLFISTVGMNYCLTFPVSSKALLMFQELESETWQPRDLLRLSAALIPIHLALIVLFYFGYWSWVGLAL